LLIRPFARREAVLSSRIEGTQTDLRGLYEFEVEEATGGGKVSGDGRRADALEVLNYVRAMDYGLERIHELPMSLRLIREMHGRLMHGARVQEYQSGEFRTTQNWIGPAGCTLNEAKFVPPPPDALADALGAFEKYLHVNDLPPLIRLALIHYQFEAIHPFLDGNGRIGRLLIVLLLVSWGLLPAPLLYLSAWFERHRDQYYGLLLAVSQRGAWKEWLLYFLEGVTHEADNAKAKAAELLEIQVKWRELVNANGGTAKMLTVVGMLLERPILAGTLVQERLQCSHQTAMTTLRKLARLGIVLELTGYGHHQKLFAAKDILAVVER
jgi:Fic family protein